MKSNKPIIVTAQHIEPGIAKYHGEIDLALQSIIKAAGFHYTPYAFNDGRILLVLPEKTSAFLYPNKKAVFALLDLE